MNAPDVLAHIPGYGSFTVTAEAVAMIGVFGGTLHCYHSAGGCRKQGLYFSRTEPKKYLRCSLPGNLPAGSGATGDTEITSASVMNWLQSLTAPFWTLVCAIRCSALSGCPFPRPKRHPAHVCGRWARPPGNARPASTTAGLASATCELSRSKSLRDRAPGRDLPALSRSSKSCLTYNHLLRCSCE
jgi:hypothetical protein